MGNSLKWHLIRDILPSDCETCSITLRQKYDFEKDYHYYTDVAYFRSGQWLTFNDWDEGQGLMF